jgi:diguanylate cyclase (GGDEF)-like protein
MLDIDFFKKINDTYGHNIGDTVLKSFSKRILNQIKEGDFLIRYGGEEFLLFIKKSDQNSSVRSIPERIRQAIEDSPIAVEGKIIYITVSIGVNNKPQQSVTLNEAIKIADEMLYTAKNTGRNKVVSTHES